MSTLNTVTTPEDANERKDTPTMPESVRTLSRLWAGALIIDVVHQILTLIIGVLDPSALVAAVKEQAKNSNAEQAKEMSDTLINIGVYGSMAFMTLVSLAILAVLAWMLVVLRRRGSWAPAARRMLTVFGFYFCFRAIAVFFIPIASASVPDALPIIDGSLQILSGVAAGTATYFVFLKDTVKWTGESR